MIWSTGGSVTDSIWRYCDIGHVINTPCYHVFFRSFAVLSFELYVQSIVRVLRLLNPCEIQRNALQRYLSLHILIKFAWYCTGTALDICLFLHRLAACSDSFCILEISVFL